MDSLALELHGGQSPFAHIALQHQLVDVRNLQLDQTLDGHIVQREDPSSQYQKRFARNLKQYQPDQRLVVHSLRPSHHIFDRQQYQAVDPFAQIENPLHQNA
jgi:hypothetical protein